MLSGAVLPGTKKFVNSAYFTGKSTLSLGATMGKTWLYAGWIIIPYSVDHSLCPVLNGTLHVG